MDRLRHGEYLNRESGWSESWKVALDLSFGGAIAAIYVYFNVHNPETAKNVLLGVFFSVFPDGLTLLYWKARVKILKIIFDFHAKMHRYPPFSPEREWNLRNSLNDILFSILAVLALFF